MPFGFFEYEDAVGELQTDDSSSAPQARKLALTNIMLTRLNVNRTNNEEHNKEEDEGDLQSSPEFIASVSARTAQTYHVEPSCLFEARLTCSDKGQNIKQTEYRY